MSRVAGRGADAAQSGIEGWEGQPTDGLRDENCAPL